MRLFSYSIFMDLRAETVIIFLCAVAVAAPFGGALLVAIARYGMSPSITSDASPAPRPNNTVGMSGWLIPAIAVVAGALCALAVGWLWWIGAELTWRTAWFSTQSQGPTTLPLHIGFGWHIDSLSLFFAVIAAGFGLLTLVFSWAYLPRMAGTGPPRWDPGVYYAALLCFTGAMVGLLLSEDLFQLYIFWELTDIASFLLIGLDRRNKAARHAAVKALLITALGGLALLAGMVGLALMAGTSSIPQIVSQGAAGFEGGPAALVALLFVIAATTKSAQFPFYVWLPRAMIAPTPVNAFLDSAALVAAGLFLAIRFTPVFEGVALWTTLLIGLGATSMLLGGLLAVQHSRQSPSTGDAPKWLLAYSTLSMFGFMFVLTGLGEIFAALWFMLQHAIIKSGLFFAAGMVEAGQEDQREGAKIPARLTWVHGLALLASGILALSLVGVPPFAGFWMKEIFLADVLCASSWAICQIGSSNNQVRLFLALIGVAAAALTLVYMARFLSFVFLRTDSGHPVRGWGLRAALAFRPSIPMIGVILLPASLVVIFGLHPELASRTLVEPAARAVTPPLDEVEFAYHLSIEFLLSLIAILLGVILFWQRKMWQPRLAQTLDNRWTLDSQYQRTASNMVALGRWVQRIQNGSLQRYLHIAGGGLITLMLFTLPVVGERPWYVPGEGGPLWLEPIGMRGAAAMLLLLIAGGTVAAFIATTHLRMVLTLGAVGFLIAGLFGLFAAPSLGLVQVHVETLVTVLFIVILVRVPHRVRKEMEIRPFQQEWGWTRVVIAGVLGVASAWISWIAINHQPANPVAPWYNEQAAQLVGAEDVVAAILVQFRALDTLAEIVVFSITALGVLALARLMSKERE